MLWYLKAYLLGEYLVCSAGCMLILQDSQPDSMAPSLVSVLIAAYNAELWIGTTLRSVLAQTWPNVEVVVVDDGSTDGTAAIAQQHVSDTVRLIRQENRGACAARNRAFAESRGDFIQFLDADDVLAADKIERQMEYLEREPENTVAYSSWSRFTGDVATADTVRMSPDWQDFEPASDWLIQSWEGRGTSFPGAWLIPRHLVEWAGPWSEGLLRNQDGEFMTRVLLAARKVKFCPEAWATTGRTSMEVLANAGRRRPTIVV